MVLMQRGVWVFPGALCGLTGMTQNLKWGDGGRFAVAWIYGFLWFSIVFNRLL